MSSNIQQVETTPLDEHLRGGGTALLERERERIATELARDDALGVGPDAVVPDLDGAARSHAVWMAAE